MVTENLARISQEFVPGLTAFDLIESGHINKTYIASDGSGTQIILQAINTHVFTNYEAIVTNFEKIAPHCGSLIPTLISTQDGRSFLLEDNEVWRAFEFVKGSRTILQVENENQAFYGAQLFGSFLDKCSIISPDSLQDTIPGFHDLNSRIERFQTVLSEDTKKRAGSIQPQIRILDKYYYLGREYSKALQSLPERVVHNDTKPSNILFAQNSDTALKVIDLDTVMKGLVITDFGDMVRSFTPTGAEDDPSASAGEIKQDIYQAIQEGFLEATDNFLFPEERSLMKLGSQCIIFEQALRFLTDYLEGDIYYKTIRDHQNIDRAIHQLNILQSL